MFDPKAVTLATDRIELVPLSIDHAQAFRAAGNFDDIWTWMVPNPCVSLASTTLWLEQALELQSQGLQVPFVIIDKATQTLVGSTRYLSIARADKGLEIGHTFITPAFWRTHVNSHAKYCLLQHAFEHLGAIRVEFKTHELNQKSRRAIARLGAQFEGILRQQRILSNGNIRNTALFSILDNEWPAVKQLLSTSLEHH